MNDRKLVTAVAKAIRHFRKERHLSQEALADRADLDRTYISGVERGVRNITLDSLEQIICALEVDIQTFFNYVTKEHDELNSEKQSISYIINEQSDTSFLSGLGKRETLDKGIFTRALLDCESVIKKITYEIQVDIFEVLGMRNLSAFIGELFVMSLVKESNHLFVKNPHQDGYPDLLLMDDYGKNLFERLRKEGKLQDKSPFSPFDNGGLEVKATCGSVPSPRECSKKGLEKPDMGDTRIDVLKSYDWKAHHRQTNNLVGILWDFYNGIPQIVAVFFSNALTEEDWGKIVQPKKGGGRTTSVSIMPRQGVKKMYQNWIAVIDDQRYIKFINKYNKNNLISK